MINEIKNDILLEKCIKCGNTHDLNSYTWKKKIKVQARKKDLNILFSSCRQCTPGFESFNRLQDKRKYGFKRISPCLWAITWMFFILGIFFLFLGDILGLIGLIISGLILFFIIIKNLNFILHPYNPKKFIKIDYHGNFSLKSSTGGYTPVVNVTQEIERKMQEIQETSYHYCPNCGSNRKTLTGFCKNCGKNLKVIS